MKWNYIRIVTLAFGVLALGLGAAHAGAGDSAPEGAPAVAEGSEAASPPRAPLKVNVVDFQDTAEGAGKLTLGGIALPGRELFLFLDDAPIGKVMPDDGGKWSYEAAMTLGDGRHTLRADQYDVASEMLAARAIVTIARAKPEDGATAPGGQAPAAGAPN
ncbi:MAG TPA: hypothetical protein VJT12_02140 [Methyloceanibacter sp.]|jgi:hypothetical protein|nr:hypothetical protein [Methyloceanibacter sp.]